MNQRPRSRKYFENRNILYEYEDIMVYGPQRNPGYAIKLDNKWYTVAINSWDSCSNLNDYESVKRFLKTILQRQKNAAQWKYNKLTNQLARTTQQLTLIEQTSGVLDR